MANAIIGHSAPKSAMTMAIVAISWALPLLEAARSVSRSRLYNHEAKDVGSQSYF